MVHLGSKRKVEIYKSYFARSFCRMTFPDEYGEIHNKLL